MKKERIFRPLDWSFPSRPVTREVLKKLPEKPTKKPPLLFVHGAMHGAWCWDEFWMPEAARQGWPCYAVSLRGHGTHDNPNEHTRSLFRDYVHDVMQTIIELPEPPILIGHSMGGAIVQRVLEIYPARAGVLIASHSPFGGLSMARQIWQQSRVDFVRALFGKSIPAHKKYFCASSCDHHVANKICDRLRPATALNQYEMLLPRRPRASRAPVLVMGAGSDGLVPFSDVIDTAKHYQADMKVFPQSGHCMMLEEDWREPLDFMLSWLEREILLHVSDATASPRRKEQV